VAFCPDNYSTDANRISQTSIGAAKKLVLYLIDLDITSTSEKNIIAFILGQFAH